VVGEGQRVSGSILGDHRLASLGATIQQPRKMMFQRPPTLSPTSDHHLDGDSAVLLTPRAAVAGRSWDLILRPAVILRFPAHRESTLR
jgi:hypothetical protein